MPIVNRPPINSINGDEHYEALVKRQTKNNKNNDTLRNYASFSMGSTVVAQYEGGGMAQWWGAEIITTTVDHI